MERSRQWQRARTLRRRPETAAERGVLVTCMWLAQVNLVDSRTTAAIIEGIREMWIRPYGPPRLTEPYQAEAWPPEAKRCMSMLGASLGEMA